MTITEAKGFPRPQQFFQIKPKSSAEMSLDAGRHY